MTSKRTISNPLVLIIAIQEYDSKKWHNLPLDNDVVALEQTWHNVYGFDTCPSKLICSKYMNKKHWKRNEIIGFINDARKELFDKEK